MNEITLLSKNHNMNPQAVCNWYIVFKVYERIQSSHESELGNGLEYKQ